MKFMATPERHGREGGDSVGDGLVVGVGGGVGLEWAAAMRLEERRRVGFELGLR